METGIVGDVETVVMEKSLLDSPTPPPVHVEINPGMYTTNIKDAVPPVQTAVSKIKMVKDSFLKRETKIPILSFLSFFQAMSTAPKD